MTADYELAESLSFSFTKMNPDRQGHAYSEIWIPVVLRYMDIYAHADTEQARAELKRIKPKLDELNQSADKIISMPNLA